jgi:hypothetical protein
MCGLLLATPVLGASSNTCDDARRELAARGGS